jgi:hypothetical protein
MSAFIDSRHDRGWWLLAALSYFLPFELLQTKGKFRLVIDIFQPGKVKRLECITMPAFTTYEISCEEKYSPGFLSSLPRIVVRTMRPSSHSLVPISIYTDFDPPLCSPPCTVMPLPYFSANLSINSLSAIELAAVPAE